MGLSFRRVRRCWGLSTLLSMTSAISAPPRYLTKGRQTPRELAIFTSLSSQHTPVFSGKSGQAYSSRIGTHGIMIMLGIAAMKARM